MFWIILRHVVVVKGRRQIGKETEVFMAVEQLSPDIIFPEFLKTE